MEKADIEPHRRYAIRERVSEGEPLQRVEVVDRVRNAKWKVRFLDEPNPGLLDYISSKQIVCRWAERHRFLRDEQRLVVIDSLDENVIDGHPRTEAVSLVLASSGEPDAALWRGRLSISPDQLERIMARAGLQGKGADIDPLAFVDRHGEAHVPFRAAERLAQAFAATEPKTVLLAVRQEEDRLEAAGWLPGERYKHKRLQELRPSFALARQWAGFQTQLDALEAEVKRLQTIIQRTVNDLRSLGAERQAKRAERELRGG
jgi:hypothetical protein